MVLRPRQTYHDVSKASSLAMVSNSLCWFPITLWYESHGTFSSIINLYSFKEFVTFHSKLLVYQRV